MHKNFRNDIWTTWCVRRFQSYEFEWHVLTAKSVKGQFFNNFFGHLMTSEVKGQFYKVEANLVNYMHKNFCNDIWTT